MLIGGRTEKRPVAYAIALCLALAAPSAAAAGGVYKWVDESGKVHYTETPPSQGDASRVAVPAPGSNNAPEISQGESVRGPDGQCVTIKCMADEMEAARLQREQGYARQRAENERHMQKPVSGPKELPPQGGGLYSDEYMRTQCLHGQCGSTRDCDNIQKLRECAAMQRADRELYQRNREMGVRDRHGNLLP